MSSPHESDVRPVRATHSNRSVSNPTGDAVDILIARRVGSVRIDHRDRRREVSGGSTRIGVLGVVHSRGAILKGLVALLGRRLCCLSVGHRIGELINERTRRARATRRRTGSRSGRGGVVRPFGRTGGHHEVDDKTRNERTSDALKTHCASVAPAQTHVNERPNR